MSEVLVCVRMCCLRSFVMQLPRPRQANSTKLLRNATHCVNCLSFAQSTPSITHTYIHTQALTHIRKLTTELPKAKQKSKPK